MKNQVQRLDLFSKTLYGRTLIYPACKNSRLICDLLETKTIAPKHLATLQSLGYEINWLSEAEFNHQTKEQ